MTYRMAVGDAEEELPVYVDEGRWIVQQELALTPAQKAKMLEEFRNVTPRLTAERQAELLAAQAAS